MGAEVIKIESRNKPDHTRRFSMTTGGVFDDLDCSPVFNDINLNKLGVTIDLGKSAGAYLAKRIVALSDVVVQNMRPGAMERLGLSYSSVNKIKPDIIYLSSSLRGSTGPECEYGGYAPNFAAVSGLSYITGYADDLPAGFMGEIDLMSAATAAFGILAALNHRVQTGEGQHIDISSSDAISVLIGEVLMDYIMNGRIQERRGNDDAVMAPHNCYRCKGEDRWVSIAVANDAEWDCFCEALDHPDWTRDSRFSDTCGRWHNREELDRLIEHWTVSHTNYEVMDILQRAGVAAIPSFCSEELYTDRHLNERGLWIDVEHPVIGKQTVVAPPWKMSDTSTDIYRHAPLLGEHNQFVFGELLGMSTAEITELVNDGVIY
jgi:benzylsuccinate CoA-transferase BbsF subunit